MTTAPFIRRALPAEAPLLSALAFRSKAHWGYDDAFMEAARGDLTFSPEEIAGQATFVLEQVGRVLGFYTLRMDEATSEGELTNLWLEPESIGQGHGRRLFEHAVATARARGCATLLLDADPHAEPFYRAMGMERIGQRPSPVIPGRLLPRMRYALGEDPSPTSTGAEN